MISVLNRHLFDISNANHSRRWPAAWPAVSTNSLERLPIGSMLLRNDGWLVSSLAEWFVIGSSMRATKSAMGVLRLKAIVLERSLGASFESDFYFLTDLSYPRLDQLANCYATSCCGSSPWLQIKY